MFNESVLFDAKNDKGLRNMFGLGGTAASSGAIIESIQEFTVTIAGASLTGTATISSIDNTRSIIRWDPWNCYSSAGTVSAEFTSPRIELTNSTTVTVTRGAQNGTTTLTVTGRVITYLPGVLNSSVQRGTTTGVTASQNQTISSVTTARAHANYLGFSSTTASGRGYGPAFAGYVFVNSSTNLRIEVGSASAPTKTYSWEIYEFAAAYCEGIYPDVSVTTTSIPNNASQNRGAWKTGLNTGPGNNVNTYINTSNDLNNLVLLPSGYNFSPSGVIYDNRIWITAFTNFGIHVERGAINTATASETFYTRMLQFKKRSVKRQFMGIIQVGSAATTANSDTIIDVTNDVPIASKIDIINLGFICNSSGTDPGMASGGYDSAKHSFALSYDSTNKQIKATRGTASSDTTYYIAFLAVEYY
jgi:hypothetical protein